MDLFINDKIEDRDIVFFSLREKGLLETHVSE